MDYCSTCCGLSGFSEGLYADWDHHPAVQQYAFIKRLGEGGFSEVQLARDKLTGKVVALKIVFLNKAGLNGEQRRILAGEARLVRMVAHPHIIRCWQVLETTKQQVLVLEHLSGGEMLHQLQQVTRYTEEHACQLFRQVADAVAYLHSLSIMHRDIKPENCLLAKPAQHYAAKGKPVKVKLIDLGMAGLYRLKKPLHGCMGSPGFIAPEVILGDAHTPAMDIYSLGVLLFVMLVGCKPWDGQRSHTLQYAILTTSEAPGLTDPGFKALSSSAQQLLLAMLHEDPGQRPSAGQVLAHTWVVKGCQASRDGGPPGRLIQPAVQQRLHLLGNSRQVMGTAKGMLLLHSRGSRSSAAAFHRAVKEARLKLQQQAEALKAAGQLQQLEQATAAEASITKAECSSTEGSAAKWRGMGVNAQEQQGTATADTDSMPASQPAAISNQQRQVIQQQCNNNSYKGEDLARPVSYPGPFIVSESAATSRSNSPFKDQQSQNPGKVRKSSLVSELARVSLQQQSLLSGGMWSVPQTAASSSSQAAAVTTAPTAISRASNAALKTQVAGVVALKDATPAAAAPAAARDKNAAAAANTSDAITDPFPWDALERGITLPNPEVHLLSCPQDDVVPFLGDRAVTLSPRALALLDSEDRRCLLQAATSLDDEAVFGAGMFSWAGRRGAADMVASFKRRYPAQQASNVVSSVANIGRNIASSLSRSLKATTPFLSTSFKRATSGSIQQVRGSYMPALRSPQSAVAEGGQKSSTVTSPTARTTFEGVAAALNRSTVAEDIILEDKGATEYQAVDSCCVQELIHSNSNSSSSSSGSCMQQQELQRPGEQATSSGIVDSVTGMAPGEQQHKPASISAVAMPVAVAAQMPGAHRTLRVSVKYPQTASRQKPGQSYHAAQQQSPLTPQTKQSKAAGELSCSRGLSIGSPEAASFSVFSTQFSMSPGSSLPQQAAAAGTTAAAAANSSSCAAQNGQQSAWQTGQPIGGQQLSLRQQTVGQPGTGRQHAGQQRQMQQQQQEQQQHNKQSRQQRQPLGKPPPSPNRRLQMTSPFNLVTRAEGTSIGQGSSGSRNSYNTTARRQPGQQCVVAVVVATENSAAATDAAAACASAAASELASRNSTSNVAPSAAADSAAGTVEPTVAIIAPPRAIRATPSMRAAAFAAAARAEEEGLGLPNGLWLQPSHSLRSPMIAAAPGPFRVLPSVSMSSGGHSTETAAAEVNTEQQQLKLQLSSEHASSSSNNSHSCDGDSQTAIVVAATAGDAAANSAVVASRKKAEHTRNISMGDWVNIEYSRQSANSGASSDTAKQHTQLAASNSYGSEESEGTRRVSSDAADLDLYVGTYTSNEDRLFAGNCGNDPFVHGRGSESSAREFDETSIQLELQLRTGAATVAAQQQQVDSGSKQSAYVVPAKRATKDDSNRQAPHGHWQQQGQMWQQQQQQALQTGTGRSSIGTRQNQAVVTTRHDSNTPSPAAANAPSNPGGSAWLVKSMNGKDRVSGDDDEIADAGRRQQHHATFDYFDEPTALC